MIPIAHLQVRKPRPRENKQLAVSISAGNRIKQSSSNRETSMKGLFAGE